MRQVIKSESLSGRERVVYSRSTFIFGVRILEAKDICLFHPLPGSQTLHAHREVLEFSGFRVSMCEKNFFVGSRDGLGFPAGIKPGLVRVVRIFDSLGWHQADDKGQRERGEGAQLFLRGAMASPGFIGR